MTRLSRRAFVAGTAGLGLLAGCGRLLRQAEQPTGRLPQIGFLSPVALQHRYADFRAGLRDLGYLEGQNIAIEQRFAEPDEQQLPLLAAELVQLRADVIVAGGTSAALAAKQVTNTIPIVFGASNEPVEAGLITSLARPGGNLTGLSLMNSQLNQKRLQLLKEAVGNVTRVAVLAYPTWATAERDWNETQVAAQRLDLQLLRLDVRRPEDFTGAFDTAVSERADALYEIPTPFFGGARGAIVELAAKHRLPAMYEGRRFVEVGGLMAYGADAAYLFRRAAYYVDRILKGTKPADLPVEQPMTFEFVVNLKTAQALGITFPNEILLQVTEVIQ